MMPMEGNMDNGQTAGALGCVDDVLATEELARRPKRGGEGHTASNICTNDTSP
jgi:hypothetical protein